MSCKLNGGSRKRRSVRKSRKNRSRRGGIGFGKYQFDVRGNVGNKMGVDLKKDRGMMTKANEMGAKGMDYGRQARDKTKEAYNNRFGSQKAGRRRRRRSRKSRKTRKSGGGFFGLFGSNDDDEEENKGGTNDLAVADSADGMGPGMSGGKSRRRRRRRGSRKSRKGRKSRR
jgi:hypothetical protein